MSTTPVTYVLIALNVLAYLAVVFLLGGDFLNPTTMVLLEAGGIASPLVLGGEPWRVLTGIFLHGGLMHLGMNMYCLYQFRDFERSVGSLAYAVIYFVSGLGGALATLLTISPNTVSVGASGAVFGIFGAFGAFAILNRRHFPPENFRRIMGSIATFLGLNLIVGFAVPNIDMGAHLGGLLAGALAMSITHAFAQRRQVRLGLLLSALLMLGSLGGYVALKAPPQTLQSVLSTLQAAEANMAEPFEDLVVRFQQEKVTAIEVVKAVREELAPPWKQALGQLKAYETNDKRERAFVDVLIEYGEGWEKRLDDTVRLLGQGDSGGWMVMDHQTKSSLIESATRLEAFLK